MVETQLVERLLPPPEVRGSNPVVCQLDVLNWISLWYKKVFLRVHGQLFSFIVGSLFPETFQLKVNTFSDVPTV